MSNTDTKSLTKLMLSINAIRYHNQAKPTSHHPNQDGSVEMSAGEVMKSVTI